MVGSVRGSTGPGGSGLFPPPGASETDGETFDDVTDDFGEYDEWDYNEILATVTKQMKTYVLQPFLIGAAGAYGMSVGYAMFDFTASLFRRGKTRAS